MDVYHYNCDEYPILVRWSYSGDYPETLVTMTKERNLGVEKNVESYIENLIPIFDKVRKTLKDGGSMWVILGDDPRNSKTGVPMKFAKAMTSVGWTIYRMWFWDKAECRIRSEFTSNLNDCIFQFVKADNIPFDNKDIQLDVVDFEVPKAVRWEGSYTVAFPMEMLIRMIAGSSPVDGIVLDPFLGY